MWDLVAIRSALGNALSEALPGLNVYAFGEPQPEYPALVFGPVEAIEFHAVNTVEGVVITWGASLTVANPDQESATRNLETLLPSVFLAIEACKSTEWSNVVINEARDFAPDALDGFGCELVTTMHV